MKTKILAVLMTALSIGVSPAGIMSASAQDAPILPKKGAAQSGQSGGATQQPDAGGASSGSMGGQATQPPSGA
ncbi:Spy/CpxP family protein refolding chaperone [Rhizobium pisi]